MNIIPICVDFDGTLVEHEYPLIGKENEYCVDILKNWIKKYNCGIILYTMRSGKLLDEAVNWCVNHGIELYGINDNPSQHIWTESPKIHCVFSIDDRNVGCPLKYNEKNHAMVDWKKINAIIEPILIKMNKN